MRFIELEQKHIDRVVEIHLSELEIGVLTYFGSGFLNKMYHALLRKNWGYVALNEDDEQIVGFVFATKENISLIKCLSFGSIATFMKNILSDFRRFQSFIIAFNKLYLRKNRLDSDFFVSKIELSYFAVMEGFKGSGIGSQLIKLFEEKARSEGNMLIFTRTHNKRLVEYYKKHKKAEIHTVNKLGTYDSHLLFWRLSHS